MESRGTFVRVGLLLLVGAAVLIGLVLFLAGGQFGGGKLLESYFSESVQGLNVGGPVKYRGVNVGTITDIGLTGAEYGKGMLAEELDNPQYQLVFVRYRINLNRVGSLPDIADSVKAGIRARLSTQGLTGLSYIEIDFVPGAAVPPPPPWQPHAEVIPSVPSTFAQVEDVATQLAQRLSKLDIEALVNNLIGLTADLRTDLKSGDVHDAIDSVNQLLSSVQDAVKQADVPRLTGELRRTAAAMTKLADGKATQDTLASASVAANKLAEAAAKLPALIAALQATAQRADTATSDLTSDLAPILRDAAAAMANLRDTTAALRRDPGQVLFGGPPPHAAQGDSR